MEFLDFPDNLTKTGLFLNCIFHLLEIDKKPYKIATEISFFQGRHFFSSGFCQL